MTRRIILIATVLLILAGCAHNETLTAYGAGDQTWQLSDLDGQAFPAPATITFADDARFSGTAPCNSYSGTITAPYPWFDTGPIVVTRMSCPDQAQEVAFFAALNAMTLAEVSGRVLVLSDAQGREMVFKAAE